MDLGERRFPTIQNDADEDDVRDEKNDGDDSEDDDDFGPDDDNNDDDSSDGDNGKVGKARERLEKYFDIYNYDIYGKRGRK